MTTREAKRIVATFLKERGMPFSKLTAKSVDFSDLARDSCIFVTVHGGRLSGAGWADLRVLAKSHDFCVES